MENNIIDKKAEPQRSETRVAADQYESVEFRTRESDAPYQFKLFDVSEKGLCFVADEDSAVLRELKVGDILNMKYYPPVSSGGAAYLNTQIRHITRAEQEGFEGQRFVGLLIVDKKEGSIMSPHCDQPPTKFDKQSLAKDS